ncbi:endonuclease III [Candidatus Fermentibacteria bacterium]|nr:MAG: endonuclease III [Candidatus Fermentibacteria bacterium]
MAVASGEQGIPSPLAAGRDPFRVLVGTVVSLRTRDAVTEKVTARVFSRVSSPAEMYDLDQSELAELLYPAGFYRRKAAQLLKLCSILLCRYDGKVPSTREELESLPGVGEKTAAFVLSMAFGIPAVCVDIHVHRISNRLGLVKTTTPSETEAALMKIFPKKLWIPLNHVFVRFGQRVCLPVGPRCVYCPLKGWCLNAS